MRTLEHRAVNEEVARFRHLGRVRRTFSRIQLNARVGWVEMHELHRIDCPEFVDAERRRKAIRVGGLHRVFAALSDDYVDGRVGFPAMHDCLRDKSTLN